MKTGSGIAVVLAASVWAVAVASASEPENNKGVTVTLYDSNGVSSDSAADHLLEIILFKSHTHIHLKVSNTTDKGLTLWRPYCPEGDAAMNIEFREIAVPDKIFRASAGMGYAYTAGMGIPKVFILAPRNDLIVNVDFLGEWNLPFAVKAGEAREFEMRAVYSSGPLADRRKKQLFGTEVGRKFSGVDGRGIDHVWSGVAVSNWQRVRVSNRTEATVGASE